MARWLSVTIMKSTFEKMNCLSGVPVPSTVSGSPLSVGGGGRGERDSDSNEIRTASNYSMYISYWMGSHPLSLDIGRVCAIFGRV